MGCQKDCSCNKSEHAVGNISPSNNIDDIWGDDDVEENLSALSNADIKRMHEKQGYLDGLSSAKESGLQKGFDFSYPLGASLGIRVGKILAILKSCSDENLFHKGMEELNIAKILSKRYFDDNLELKSTHEVLDKWEKIISEL